MNFQEALQAMKNGKKIRRPNFDGGCYLSIIFGVLYTTSLIRSNLDGKDILEEDWEIVE